MYTMLRTVDTSNFSSQTSAPSYRAAVTPGPVAGNAEWSCGWQWRPTLACTAAAPPHHPSSSAAASWPRGSRNPENLEL